MRCRATWWRRPGNSAPTEPRRRRLLWQDSNDLVRAIKLPSAHRKERQRKGRTQKNGTNEGEMREEGRNEMKDWDGEKSDGKTRRKDRQSEQASRREGGREQGGRERTRGIVIDYPFLKVT